MIVWATGYQVVADTAYGDGVHSLPFGAGVKGAQLLGHEVVQRRGWHRLLGELFQERPEFVVGSERGVHVLKGGQHPPPELRVCRGGWVIHGLISAS